MTLSLREGDGFSTTEEMVASLARPGFSNGLDYQRTAQARSREIRRIDEQLQKGVGDPNALISMKAELMQARARDRKSFRTYQKEGATIARLFPHGQRREQRSKPSSGGIIFRAG